MSKPKDKIKEFISTWLIIIAVFGTAYYFFIDGRNSPPDTGVIEIIIREGGVTKDYTRNMGNHFLESRPDKEQFLSDSIDGLSWTEVKIDEIVELGFKEVSVTESLVAAMWWSHEFAKNPREFELPDCSNKPFVIYLMIMEASIQDAYTNGHCKLE